MVARGPAGIKAGAAIMTGARQEILRRIAAAEAALSPDDRTPWEIAADEHKARVDELYARWQAARSTAEATQTAARQAYRAMARHDDTLLSVDLAEVPAWAEESRRLAGIFQALTNRHKAEKQLAEHVKQVYAAEADNNPAAIVRANHIANLRAILGGRASEKEKRAAMAELEKIADSERVKVTQITPPGFDPRAYDEKGNLIR